MVWSEIPGWFDFAAVYDEAVDRFPSGSTFVEVGVFLGRSLVYLADRIKKSGKYIRLVGVDTFTGSGVENDEDHHARAVADGGGTFVGQTHRNLIACGHPWVELVVADSVKAADFFNECSIDFLFLDARHDYESVKADIEEWRGLVRRGGVLAGDDYGVPGHPVVWPGVRRAVEELLPGFELRPHDAWYWSKK